MIYDNEKLEILLNDYEVALNSFEIEKELLSRIIATVSVFNIELAFKLWEKMLIQLENDLKGNNFNVKRIDDYYDITNVFVENFGDDFDQYMCIMPFDMLKVFHNKEVIFEHLRMYPTIIEKLFSKDNVINYLHSQFILYLFSVKEYNLSISLLNKFRQMAFIYDKGDMPEERYTHASAVGYILRHMPPQIWEEVRIRLNDTINKLAIIDPINEISLGINMRMRNRVDLSQCMLDFVRAVSTEDFKNANLTFKQILESVDFDFSLDYFFYRSIQSIKIDAWMNCDSYIYELLDNNMKQPFSEKLKSAIDKKKKLKNNRILKGKAKNEK